MMSNEMIERIRTIEKKAVMYDQMKGRYVEVARDIAEVGERLKAIAQQLDPVVKVGESRTYNRKDDIIAELFVVMEKGTHLDTDLIRATYPELDDNAVYYIFTKLRSMKGVCVRTEGRRKFLYL